MQCASGSNGQLETFPEGLNQNGKLQKLFVKDSGLNEAHKTSLKARFPRLALDERVPPEAYLQLP